MSWQRSIETSLGISFEAYLQRRWDVQRDFVKTSPRQLVAGCAKTLNLLQIILLLVKEKSFAWKMTLCHLLVI